MFSVQYSEYRERCSVVGVGFSVFGVWQFRILNPEPLTLNPITTGEIV